jgi:hypothetical protein
MINRPDPSNSPDRKMSTAERPILVEADLRRHRYGVSGHLSELTSEGPLRFPNYWNAWKVRAKKSLTSTLRGLERDSLVRSIPARVPVRVDYEAPALGHELIVKFQPFWSWCGKDT